MSNPNINSEIGQASSHDPILTESQLHEAIAKALKRCSRSKTRDQVANELRELTGLNITKRNLDDWSSPSKPHLRVPAVMIEPLGRITGTPDLEMMVVGQGLRDLIAEGARHLELRGLLAHLRRSAEALDKAQRKAAKIRTLVQPREKRKR